MFSPKQFLALTLLATGQAVGADATSVKSPRAASELDSLPLQPVYRVKAVDGKKRFATPTEFDFKKLQLEGVVFLAVCTNEWPAGLVPVFIVEKTNRFELRRRPALGEENSAEPLFFALPPEDEPDASKLVGRWKCQAIRGDGSKAYLAWELAIEADKVSGRFDQNTDYRVAFIAGGTFRSNRLELRVEYFNDAYLLTGEWRDGKLKGPWRHLENSERGTWEASRAESRFPASKEIVPLYEWRRPSDDTRRYALEGERIDPGWERSPRPLCQVWRNPGEK